MVGEMVARAIRRCGSGGMSAEDIAISEGVDVAVVRSVLAADGHGDVADEITADDYRAMIARAKDFALISENEVVASNMIKWLVERHKPAKVAPTTPQTPNVSFIINQANREFHNYLSLYGNSPSDSNHKDSPGPQVSESHAGGGSGAEEIGESGRIPEEI